MREDRGTLRGRCARDAKRVADRGTSRIDQLALAMLIESGRYDRHLRRMRAVYARRRAIVSAHVPHVTGLAAGFHAVLRLPAGASEQGVVAAARERGVGVYGMSDYRADGSTEPPCLVLGFGNTSEQAIESGLQAIADLLT